MEQKNVLFEKKATEIFDEVAGNLDAYTRIPVSTYRVQFNHQFKFADAKRIVSYLNHLGISDCYASPYFKAQKGSLHGYDILDHSQLNPEIGREEDYEEFVKELKKYEMGQVLDIVPNHMAIAGSDNQWWMDVLENGPSSLYADFFDIDWKPVKGELENKVLLPILGDQYGRVLENQELVLIFEEGAFFISYYDRKLPVAPASYAQILRFRIEGLEKKIGSDHPSLQELLSIITALSHLPSRKEKDREKITERRREKEVIKRRLWDLYHEDEEVKFFIGENVRIFNGEKGDARSFDLLDELLNDQVYRLSHWRVAMEEINYRRFFDINELAAIRMDNPNVFEEAHQLVFELIRERKVTGLRVDHPDGLYNPAEYFYQLQRSCFIQFCLHALSAPPGQSSFEPLIEHLYDETLSQNPSSPLRMPLYIVGEKILTKSERMPEDWPIFSTTGYVFLNSVNGIFIDMDHAKAFEDIYTRFIRSKVDFQDLFYEKKKLFMLTSMSSEINTLGHYLNRISEKNRHTRDFTLNSLTTVIAEVIANFPVYRTYVTRSGVNERDIRYVEQAVSRAKRKNPALSATIFDFLQTVLLLRYPEDFNEEDKSDWLDFAMRFQQITGPVMAKGIEDTAFYVYNRFISLNEVGGNPERFGTPLDTFHGQNIERTKYWPHAMIATSTHDTKRSEDVRARLNVLSEIPEEWRRGLIRWSRMNKRKKSVVVDGQLVPDRNEEYSLYQTLAGAWPLSWVNEKDDEIFRGRVKDYVLKAAREAKANTSWISPNIPYEEKLTKFVDVILSPSPNNQFLKDFGTFQEKISYLGMFNGLSQTLLKITCPGIPDFYQGTELWDFSLVDPDNRRPIDYDARRRMLERLMGTTEMSQSDRIDFVRKLLESWRDGCIKLYVTFKALNYRKENRQLFREGAYIPLTGDGDLKEHVCAFARKKEDKLSLTVVPRFLSRLLNREEDMPFGRRVWGESRIVVSDEIPGDRFQNILTGETLQGVDQNGQKALLLGDIFAHFPVAMLEGV
jgi:(1->4)-alpha-D-glucan 1-alpha-D-glucosylmutase